MFLHYVLPISHKGLFMWAFENTDTGVLELVNKADSKSVTDEACRLEPSRGTKLYKAKLVGALCLSPPVLYLCF